MRSLSSFAILFGLASAVPISNAPQDHPVLQPLALTSQQLGIVVTELGKYNGNDPMLSDQIIRHSQETLRTLEAALIPLREQKASFDYTTTFQLASPLLSLDSQVHQLASTLKTKKDMIDRDRMSPLVFNMLKQTQVSTTELCDKIVQYLPVGISAATGILAAEIKSVLAGIVDLYKPAADVTVIIADPNRPFSGGFTVQQAPSQNAPYPPQPQQQGPRPPYPPQQGPPQQQGPRPPYPPQQIGGPYPQQNQQQGGQQPPPWYRPNPNQLNSNNNQPQNNPTPPPGYSWYKGSLH